ncbi:MAG: DUF2490 domain-containing protein [Bacteroidetes bacterium]|nr:DUF2490 domain-containing protein [Bacteroidota bacterium]
MLDLTLTAGWFLPSNDAGIWVGVNLEKKISKQLSAHVTQEFRFNENWSELGAFFTELSGEYRLSKAFSIAAGYRFINKRNLDDSYSKRHRFIAEANARKKFGNVNAALWVSYQSQYKDYTSSAEGQVPDNYLRTRLKLKYDLNKKYAPFISGESFFYMNRPDGILFNNYRLVCGAEYEFSKKSSVEAAFIFNREVNISDPWTSYILGVGWNYVLK